MAHAIGYEIDYDALCMCNQPNLKEQYREEYNRQFGWDLSHDMEFFVKTDCISYPEHFPLFLNSDEKWNNTIFRTNCIHRWLHLMEYVFNSTAPLCDQYSIVEQLVTDLMEVYPCHYQRYLFEDDVTGRDFQHFQSNGDNYKFTPPLYHHFPLRRLPLFIATPLGWNTIVCDIISDFHSMRRFFAYVFQRVDPEKQHIILWTFNRHYVYHRNSLKNVQGVECI